MGSSKIRPFQDRSHNNCICKGISLTAKVSFLAFKKAFSKLKNGEKIEKEKKIGGTES